MKYASLIDELAKPRTVTPLEREGALAQSVQTSLFQRLRKEHGGPLAGRLAWLLVRSTQERHSDCNDANAALASLPVEKLQTLASAARGARDNLRDRDAAALAGEVAEVLGLKLAARAMAARAGR